MIRIKDGFKGGRSLVMPKLIVEYMEKDSLLSLLHITDIGFFPHAKHHYIERHKPISEYVFIYCVEGAGWYCLSETHYNVCAGQFFILPICEPHSYGTEESNPWTIYWMHFKGNIAKAITEGLIGTHTILPTNDSRISDRVALFEEMYFSLKASLSRENILYANSILYHFIGSLKCILSYREAGRIGETNPTEKCQQVIHFMKENIEGHLSLVQMAEFTGYSPNHFATLFKNTIGHAPVTYFNLLKIQTAANLLDSTDLRINQIASKLGYEDSGYFTRLFTKVMGMSPKQYRLTIKG